MAPNSWRVVSPLQCAATSNTRVQQWSPTQIFHRLRTTTNVTEPAKLHSLLVVNGSLQQTHSHVLAAQLVGTYVNLNFAEQALKLFDHLPKRNSFAWNSILKGLLHMGHSMEVLEYYRRMADEGIVPDNFTYPSVLKACSNLLLVEEGRIVHAQIKYYRTKHGYTPNVFVQCAVIDMFAKCGYLDEARKVFDEMSVKDLVSWTTMICATTQVGDWVEALRLFSEMRSQGFGLDSVVVATVLPPCGRLGNLNFGMGMHSSGIKTGISKELTVLNATIDMYSKCGRTDVARRIFLGMEQKDVVTWSSLIAGYSQNQEFQSSLEIYSEMIGSGVRPSSVTIASVLPSLAETELLKQGRVIHGYAIRHGLVINVFVASALVDFYCRCGFLREAQFVFETSPEKEIAICNSMIAGFVMAGDVESTLGFLRRIDIKPNSITLITVLPLFASMSMLRQGKEVHGHIVKSGLLTTKASTSTTVANSLIDMYCKCGCLELGEKLFSMTSPSDRTVVTYNTIIAAVGMNGNTDLALSYLDEMQFYKIIPDKVTFVAVLSACSHGGRIDQGLKLYRTMINTHRIPAEMEHYSCVVDMYSRSGQVEQAWEFIRTMPVEPDSDVVGCVLGGCRVSRRMDVAEAVGKWILEKKPEDPGYYVLLCNIYASCGKWVDEEKVRENMKDRGVVKNPGYSWIQTDSTTVHYFTAQGKTHMMFDEMSQILDVLFFQMKDSHSQSVIINQSSDLNSD